MSKTVILYSIDYAVNYWLHFGAKNNKLSIVIPFFGVKQVLLPGSPIQPYADTDNTTRTELIAVQDACRLRRSGEYNAMFVDEWAAPVLISKANLRQVV